MTNTLQSDPVAATLTRLYALAGGRRTDRGPAGQASDGAPGGRPGPGVAAGVRPGPPRRPRLSSTASAQERADAMSEVYMPISPMAGVLAYSLIRASRPQIVVEFGMSFGISTLHLASALRDNGSGRLYTTELSARKITAARETFAETGLDDVITVLEGDALQTLKQVDGEIGFVLLDGWKEMYRPVLRLLEGQLPAGALVLADNTEHLDTAEYLEYVRDPANGYLGVNFPAKERDTMELSCRL